MINDNFLLQLHKQLQTNVCLRSEIKKKIRSQKQMVPFKFNANQKEQGTSKEHLQCITQNYAITYIIFTEKQHR